MSKSVYRSLKPGEKIQAGDEAYTWTDRDCKMLGWRVYSKDDVKSLGAKNTVDAGMVPWRRLVNCKADDSLIESAIKTLIERRLVSAEAGSDATLNAQLRQILSEHDFSVAHVGEDYLATLWEGRHKSTVRDLLKLDRYANRVAWQGSLSGKAKSRMIRSYSDGDQVARLTLRQDLEIEHGLAGHPKADLLWSKAWEAGHGYGLLSIIESYEDLMELVK